MAEGFDGLFHSGVVAIMRAEQSDVLIQVARSIHAGGVHFIEVTMTTPGALQVIGDAKRNLDAEVRFGAGSVLDGETARQAILMGADFIVTPVMSSDAIRICRRYGTPIITGAYTPTEVLTAWELGSDLVKVFPASIGGPSHIKAVLAPLPQVKLVPVGGVSHSNTADYIAAGAFAVGVGSSLVNQQLIVDGAFDQIEDKARELVQAVQKVRPAG